jgi:hypothetical protein
MYAQRSTADTLQLPKAQELALYAPKAQQEQQFKRLRANAIQQAKQHRGPAAAEWQKRAFSELDSAFKQGFYSGLSANDRRLDFDEFEGKDEDNLREIRYQLGIVDTLINAGFTKDVSPARTVYVKQREGKWEIEAETSMDGRAKSRQDEAPKDIIGVPLPFTHVDYEISTRLQQQSQNFGESIDDEDARQAGRILREGEEFQTLDGWGNTVPDSRGNPLEMHGLRDSEVSITGTASGDWGTPSNVLDTIDKILNAFESQSVDNNRGPDPVEQGMWLWYHPNQRSDLRAADPRGDGNMSLMSRIQRDYPYINMQANGALNDGELVAMVRDRRFGEILNGQAPTNLSEDMEFGLATKYKALSMRVPFFRSTYDGIKGCLYYTGAQ